MSYPKAYYLLVCFDHLAFIRYKLDNAEVLSGMDRVMAVPGDLSRPLLGLDDTSFKAREETQHTTLFIPLFRER